MERQGGTGYGLTGRMAIFIKNNLNAKFKFKKIIPIVIFLKQLISN